MPLTDAEKVKIRDHLGYMNQQEVETFHLGTPAATETSFVIEPAMDKVPESSLPRLRQILAVLDSIESQMIDDHENLAVTKIGSIELREDEQEELDKRYERWQGKLANLLGVYVNPFSKVGGTAVNVPVMN